MNRRGFLSVMTMGAVTAPAVAMGIKESSDPSDAPISEEHLSIRSGTKESNNNSSFFNERYTEFKTVSMAVGRDGNLWLKTENNEWKRVVTE